MPGRFLVLGVTHQPMCIRALDAVHTPRVFRFRAIEEFSGGPPTRALEIRYLERVQARILGERDLCLAAETEATHGDTMRAVDVRRDGPVHPLR